MVLLFLAQKVGCECCVLKNSNWQDLWDIYHVLDTAVNRSPDGICHHQSSDTGSEREPPLYI